MGAFKRILRAIFEDDGAPSLYSGLVVGASTPGRSPVEAAAAGSRRDTGGARTRSARRS